MREYIDCLKACEKARKGSDYAELARLQAESDRLEEILTDAEREYVLEHFSELVDTSDLD